MIYAVLLIGENTISLPAKGGTYREAIVQGQPKYLNPVISNANDADKDIIALVFSNVTDLAEKISVSDNLTAWTIRLRDNAYWHDGERITSDDIIFTLQSIQDAEARSPLFATWQYVVPTRVSELELTLSTKTPYAFFENNLQGLYIIPKHIFNNVPAANWHRSGFNLEPIGSGPYKLLSYKQEKSGFISEYNLTRNNRYFKDTPLINYINFVFFNDEASAIQAFNVARVDAVSVADPGNLNLVNRQHQTINVRLPKYFAVFFNQGSNDLLKNKTVRTALDYATNKSEIIMKSLSGYGVAIDGPVPINELRGLQSSAPANYDPARASAMLDAAKITKGQDGFRGEIKLVVPDLRALRDAADVLKTNWEAVGIKTTLIVLDTATIGSEVIKTRNYDAILFGNMFGSNPDMFSFWHSSERFYPGLNLSLYNNKSADSIMESMRKNFDENSRRNDLVSLQSTIANDVPAVFLYSPNYVYIADNKIHGFDPSIIYVPSDRFGNIEKWFVKTSLSLKNK